MKTKLTGFTLIELLVVIAIIGVLASVVLVSLTSARNKSVDAAIKENIVNARAQAELYYSNNGQSYAAGGVANDICSGAGGIGSLISGVTAAGGIPACFSTVTAWSLSSPLTVTPGTYFCTDNTGTSTVKTSPTTGPAC